jgi:hypothetical protein
VGNIAEVFEYFTLIKYMENASWDTYKLIVQFGMILILLMIFNMVFVGYASTRKMVGLSASVQILKALIWLITQVFYLPLFQLFIGVYRCEMNSEGNSVHYLFPELYCYSGEHLMQAIFIGFASFFLFLICILTAFFNFENSLISADITASVNGHHNVSQIVYFTVNSMCFALLHQE